MKKKKRKLGPNEALAKHLDIDLEHANLLIDRGDYLVLTDEEADEACKAAILDSVWAFKPEFLASHSEVADKEVFKLLGEKCEGGNEPMKRLIKDLDHFVEDAVACDGRGHFLSSYDGEEHEVEGFYIYRID